MLSLEWRFTLTLPELARILDLSLEQTRRAAAGCLATESVDVYSVDLIQMRFGMSDHDLLAKFREMRA